MIKKNSARFHPYFGDNYSDVTIKFSDAEKSIEMRLHRVILAGKVPYFHNLFSFAGNFRKKEFNIQVEDAAIAELFIKSLYGLEVDFTSNFRDFLLLCKLRSYFCLDIDLEQLYRVKVPAELFDLFLRVVNLPEVQVDKKLIRTIKRNIPADYTWEGVNEEFAREVTKKERYIVSADEEGTIKIWNLNIFPEENLEDIVSEDHVGTLVGHTEPVSSIVVTNDQRLIVSASEDKTVKIWEVATGKCVKTLNENIQFIRLSTSL